MALRKLPFIPARHDRYGGPPTWCCLTNRYTKVRTWHLGENLLHAPSEEQLGSFEYRVYIRDGPQNWSPGEKVCVECICQPRSGCLAGPGVVALWALLRPDVYV